MVTIDGRTTRHAQVRPELVASAADWMQGNGTGEVSLRKLAAGIGVSHAALLHHFGSKDTLLVEVVGAFRDRQRAMLDAAAASAEGRDLGEIVVATWQRLTEPAALDFVTVVFELVGMGMRDRPRFDEFLRAVVTDWTTSIQALLEREGLDPATAATRSVWVYAALRGLLLDLVTTGERKRVDAALYDLAAALSALVARDGVRA